MIKTPFKRETFSTDIKTKISGVNANFEYDNIKSALVKVGADMISVLGKATYSKLFDYYTTPDDAKAGAAEAVDALQRAMLHFAFYEHEIFITVRIGNDGITTKKNDDETTAFKYQTDALAEKLVGTAWFWLGILFDILNSNPDTFPEWKESDQNQELADLPVTAADFTKWFGVSDTYFIIKARALIRQVYNDEILPRMKAKMNDPVDGEEDNLKNLRSDVNNRMRRAVVFGVMAIACKQFAYFSLPEPIRRDISNEVTASVLNRLNAEKYIRESLAERISTNTDKYLRMLEESIQLLNQALKPPAEKPIVKEADRRESDKFVFMG